MTFRLYNVETGGSPLWTEFDTVAVSSGLFNVHLGSIEPLSVDLFDSTTRYLQVEVGGIVLSPRQRLTAVPYAIQATRAITATEADTLDGQQASDFAAVVHDHDADYVNVSGDIMSGPLNLTANDTTFVLTATNSSSFWSSGGIYGRGHQTGVYGESDGTGVSGVGDTYGVKGEGKWGVSGEGSYIGVVGHGDTYGVHGSSDSYGYGGYFYNSAPNTPTIRVRNSNSSGNLIEAYGTDNFDLEFEVTNDGNVHADGQFVSEVASGTPPLVVASHTRVDSLNADLLDGYHASDFVTGAHDHDADYVNVSGDTMSGPLTVTASSSKFVVTATNSSTAAGSGGIRGEGDTYGVSGYGDWGVSGHGHTTGVYGSGGAYGVSGYGYSTGYGGVFNNSAPTTPTLKVRNSNNNGNLIEAYGSSATDVEFKVTNSGNVYADGSFSSPASDLAEMMAVEGNVADYEPGDVLVISQSSDNTVVHSTEASSTAVIGVYSTKPAFLGGNPDEGADCKIPVAIAGIVPVKATAENGSIQRGDLLTTSDVSGHAMKAQDPQMGTILGKALQPLDDGTGVIQVMITLR